MTAISPTDLELARLVTPRQCN